SPHSAVAGFTILKIRTGNGVLPALSRPPRTRLPEAKGYSVAQLSRLGPRPAAERARQPGYGLDHDRLGRADAVAPWLRRFAAAAPAGIRSRNAAAPVTGRMCRPIGGRPTGGWTARAPVRTARRAGSELCHLTTSWLACAAIARHSDA